MATEIFTGTIRESGWRDLFWKWVPSAPRSRRASDLVDQFFATLSATYEQIKLANGDLTPFRQITAKIDGLFNGPRSWRSAYQIEQLMVPLFSGDKLDVELTRRLLEAQKFDIPISQYYSCLDLKTASDDRKRALLARLINDLQWRYEVSQLRRQYERVYAKRTSYAFLLATLAFIAPVYWILFLPTLTDGEWKVVFTVIASGLFGATFSMLVSVNGRSKEGDIDDLRSSIQRSFIWSRAFVGAGASLILYYFIISQLLDGPLFPEPPSFVTNAKEADIQRNLALLIVACFVAGFSERLVPDLLTRSGKAVDLKPSAVGGAGQPPGAGAQ